MEGLIEMKKENLIKALEIFASAGESRLEELKKSDRLDVFGMLYSDAWEFDGDGDGAYCSVRLNDLFPGKFDADDAIVFASQAEDYDRFAIEVSDLWFDFYEGDWSGDSYQTFDAVAAINYILSKIDAEVQVVNLTPHEIVIVDDAGNVTARFPASGQTARVNSRAVDLPPVAGVPVVRTEYGDIDGLPDPQANTIYLVSVIVAQALKSPRPDVFVPDTGPASVVRDSDGKIVGVKRLMQL